MGGVKKRCVKDFSKKHGEAKDLCGEDDMKPRRQSVQKGHKAVLGSQGADLLKAERANGSAHYSARLGSARRHQRT